MTKQAFAPRFLHTPGPYAVARDADGVDDLWVIYERANRDNVNAEIPFWDSSDEWMSRSLAIARLLAASPDLLQLVIRMLNPLTAAEQRSVRRRARKVIAAIAEGAPP